MGRVILQKQGESWQADVLIEKLRQLGFTARRLPLIVIEVDVPEGTQPTELEEVKEAAGALGWGLR